MIDVKPFAAIANAVVKAFILFGCIVFEIFVKAIFGFEQDDRYKWPIYLWMKYVQLRITL